MFIYLRDQIFSNMYDNIMSNIVYYAPKSIWAVCILLMGLIISVLIFEAVIYLFKRFKINNIIDNVEIKMELNLWEENSESLDDKKSKIKKIKRKKITEKFNVDVIVAKAISYYVFLLFFRYSIVIIEFRQVENFLIEVLSYLPDLFIAVCVWFFWIRFADTVYDVVYYTLELTKHQTSRIIAMWAKIVIIFFTILIVLKYVRIVDTFIINTIFVWFISTITIWAWLAFWIGWKDVAREILESFRK